MTPASGRAEALRLFPAEPCIRCGSLVTSLFWDTVHLYAWLVAITGWILFGAAALGTWVGRL